MKKIPVFLIVIIASCLISCATSHKRPCTEGGQPAREGSVDFRGIKKCYQKEDNSGKIVNDGKYFEWYNNDKIALTGQYKLGKKVGRWIEYNEKGEKISDKYFDENGKETNPP